MRKIVHQHSITWNQEVRNLLSFRIYLHVFLDLHNREFISVSLIFNSVVEQNDGLSSTAGVQLEVLNEIKRMQSSLIKHQSININASPQEQGIVFLGLGI